MAVKTALIGIWIIYLLILTTWEPAGRRPDGAAEDREPKALYNSKCASCHGIDGSANTAVGKDLKAKDLRSAKTQSLSDEQLYELIAKGRGKMPSFERSLGADKCRQLVAYIRQLAVKE